jgi:hypothetical protein
MILDHKGNPIKSEKEISMDEFAEEMDKTLFQALLGYDLERHEIKAKEPSTNTR